MIHLTKIQVKDIMVREPFTIGIDEPFGLVWDIFRLHNIRHLPVLLNDRLIVGIITQMDLYRTISPEKTPGGTLIYDLKELNRFVLKDQMSKDVISIGPDDFLGNAIDIMVKNKIGCLPIVDNTNYLLGLITRTDILKVLAKYVV